MRGWVAALAACVLAAVAQADIPEVGAQPGPRAVEVGESRVQELVRRGDVAELGQLARHHGDNQVRGWAIVGLTQIGSADAQRVLADLTNPSYPALVQTWAAAGRISTARTLRDVRELAPLRSRLPALDRPLRLRVEALAPEASLEDLLALSRDGSLAAAVAPMVMEVPSERLVQVMFEHPEDDVRRQAAAFLASKGQQGETEAVARAVLERLRLPRNRSAAVPWSGGALFIPGLQWPEPEARRLVKALMAWWLWLDARGRQAETRPVWNNLYSISLLNRAGYQRTIQPNAHSLVGAVVQVEGKAQARALLERVGLYDDPRLRELVR